MPASDETRPRGDRNSHAWYRLLKVLYVVAYFALIAWWLGAVVQWERESDAIDQRRSSGDRFSTSVSPTNSSTFVLLGSGLEPGGPSEEPRKAARQGAG